MAEPETKAAPKEPDRRRRKSFLASDDWGWTSGAYMADSPPLISPAVFDFGDAPFEGF